jgi:hypothetical protein
MSDADVRYDEKTKTYWVAYDFDDTDTLVPNDELRRWIKAVKKGETEEGEEVEAVNYIFADEGSASYNHQALAYGNIGTYVGSHKKKEEFEPAEGTPDFSTEEDFGIDS